MNSSIQAIGPSQSVKPSFGMLTILRKGSNSLHPKNVIPKYQRNFYEAVKGLNNVEIIIGDDAIKIVRKLPEVDKTENLDHIAEGAFRRTYIPERVEEHYVNAESPVSKKMGRIGINFEDGTYLLENRAIERADLNKYGRGKLQRMFATLEYVAKELNDSVKNMELFNLYGKFSK